MLISNFMFSCDCKMNFHKFLSQSKRQKLERKFLKRFLMSDRYCNTESTRKGKFYNEFLREELAVTKTNMQSQIDNIYACLEKVGIHLPINNVNQTSDVGSSHRPHVQISSHDGCSPAC
ncbi:hypothetical protein Syun_019063 [Stephania yunnanensis]|uniref:Uncharacterized protein n=1 Tax=Stephania yunnanensis TaxID=152371 RepID=A0AAP0ITF5_9MAGN